MQEVAAARVPVQVPPATVLKSFAFVPEKLKLKATGLVCLFVMVMVFETDVPHVTLPIAKLVGATFVVIVPVPETDTDCIPLPASSITVSFALRAPSALGVKPIATVHDDSEGTPSGGHVEVPDANSVGSEELTPDTISGTVERLVMVRFFVTVSPTGELPRASDTGTPAAGVGVAVAVAVLVAVAVRVAVAVAVRVAVAVLVAVAVAVFVGVAVLVAVAVGVFVGVFELVGVAVAVAVGVAVNVALAVSVAVGV